MKAYLAGKITDLPYDDVLKKFAGANKFLNSIGYEVIDPTEIITETETPWNICMKLCINELLKCDIIVLLNDWHNSKGAKIEHEISVAIGMPVYKLISTAYGYNLVGFNELDIMAAVCISCDLSVDAIKSPKRGRNLVDARRIIVKLFKDNNKSMSWGEIGKIINRDHASAMHLNSTANNLINTDKKFKEQYNKVTALL